MGIEYEHKCGKEGLCAGRMMHCIRGFGQGMALCPRFSKLL